MALTDEPTHEFLAQAQDKGLTGALQDRDQPFGDYRTTSGESED